MWVPAVLPLKYTFYALVALALTLPFALRRFTKHPVLLSLGICALSSLPLLMIVGAIIDSYRYGEFHFDSYESLADSYVELPQDATNITLRKYASGHEVKFQTSKSTLEKWMSDLTAQRSEYSDATPFVLENLGNTKWFRNDFGPEWSCPSDVIFYRGWRSARGAGFDVWYSEDSETAFIAASYW
jgi:hypothetical protein